MLTNGLPNNMTTVVLYCMKIVNQIDPAVKRHNFSTDSTYKALSILDTVLNNTTLTLNRTYRDWNILIRLTRLSVMIHSSNRINRQSIKQCQLDRALNNTTLAEIW